MYHNGTRSRARRYSTKRDAAGCYVKSLQNFLTQHLGALAEAGKPNATVSNPVGWKDNSKVYLPSNIWSSIFPATEGTSAAKALLDMQLLLPGEDGRHTRKAPRSIPGRPRLFTLNIDRVQTCKAD
jgi:putative DNA primase/helicase